MVNENMGINIEELAKNIAGDIDKLGKIAAETGGLKDLRNIDFSTFLPESTAETMKGALGQFKAKAEEAAAQNKTRVAEIAGEVEKSVKDRQVKLSSGLKELRKTAMKNDAEAKTILNRVSANIDLRTRRLNEIQIEKTVKVRNVPIRRTDIDNADSEKRG